MATAARQPKPTRKGVSEPARFVVYAMLSSQFTHIIVSIAVQPGLELVNLQRSPRLIALLVLRMSYRLPVRGLSLLLDRQMALVTRIILKIVSYSLFPVLQSVK